MIRFVYRSCVFRQSSYRVRWTSTLQLRPYQLECIQSCLDAVHDGKNRIAVSLATGGGKTVIFSHLIDRIETRDRRHQTLIVVHRRELVEQAANHCRRTCTESSVEVEMNNHNASGQADVTVCSLQSLTRRLDKYDKERIKMIIIDEAHHAAAKTYLQILEHFDAQTPDSGCIVVGFSATLFRRDGLQLASVFDHIVFHKDYMSMMRDGYLCKARFTAVKIEDVSLKGLRLTGPDSDFAPKQLSERVNTTSTNNATVRAWLDRGSNRKSTIVFAVDIQHVIDLANCFRAFGIDARAVTSRNDKVERTQLVQEFRDGKFPVLVNCGIFTEGFDSPNIDCVLLCRPTKSVGLLVQMIGRGLRLAPGKEDCHILDMTSCLDVGVASVPSLFGLDPKELVDRELSFEDIQNEVQLKTTEEPINSLNDQNLIDSAPSEVSYLDYDDMEDLMSDHENRGSLHVSRLSPLNWLQVDENKYILSLGQKGFIRVSYENESDTWSGSFTRKLPREADAMLSRPRMLFENVITLERAIAACDTAALNMAPQTMINKNATWRKAEASPAQKQFMVKLGSKDAMNRHVTRGQAQDFIVRCTHGGKSAIDRLNREKKAKYRQEVRDHKESEARIARLAKEAERAAKRDRVVDQEVRVGPIVEYKAVD